MHELVCRLYPHLLLDGATAEDAGRSLPPPPPTRLTAAAAAAAAAAATAGAGAETGEGSRDASGAVLPEGVTLNGGRRLSDVENGGVKRGEDAGSNANMGQLTDASDIYNSSSADASASGGWEQHRSCDVLNPAGDVAVSMTEVRCQSNDAFYSIFFSKKQYDPSLIYFIIQRKVKSCKYDNFQHGAVVELLSLSDCNSIFFFCIIFCSTSYHNYF